MWRYSKYPLITDQTSHLHLFHLSIPQITHNIHITSPDHHHHSQITQLIHHHTITIIHRYFFPARPGTFLATSTVLLASARNSRSAHRTKRPKYFCPAADGVSTRSSASRASKKSRHAASLVPQRCGGFKNGINIGKNQGRIGNCGGCVFSKSSKFNKDQSRNDGIT